MDTDVNFGMGPAGLERMWASAGRHRYDRHAHDEYAVIVVAEGRKLFRSGRSERVVQAGQVIVVAPGTSHDCEPAGPDTWGHCAWYVPPEVVADWVDDASLATGAPFESAVLENRGLADALQRHHEAARHDPSASEPSEHFALSAVFDGLSRGAGPEDATDRSSKEDRAALYEEILRNAGDMPLDLDRLAVAGGVSKFQVIRDMKDVHHMPPGRFLRDLRLRRSKTLLRTKTDLTQLSLDLGFSDLSHFVRSFRSAYGIPPGRYRRQVSERPRKLWS